MCPQRKFDFFIKDIIISINRIEKYIGDNNFASFMENYMLQDAVVRNFEIIREAIKGSPQEVKEKYNSIPWKEMYDLRNIISNHYFGVDYQTLWQIAKNDLPGNRQQLFNLLESEDLF